MAGMIATLNMNMSLIQTVRGTIRSLLARCNVPYEVMPFNQGLYQECIDEAMQRGYPLDGTFSVRTYLKDGVIYAATSSAHLPHRRTQVWIALFTAIALFVDDVTAHFPTELAKIYPFNKQFFLGQGQMSAVLDAFADILHQIPELFQPVATNFITTSILNFVTANLLEHETKSMQISSAAQQYPSYQRTKSGAAEAYAFLAFPSDLPLNDYVQAIPDIILFIHNVNDVFSFYKEEQVGESTNQISTLAALSGKSKLETHQGLAEATADIYDNIVKTLEGSPAACEAFRQYAAGYVYFHTSSTRYKLADLDMEHGS